MKTNIQALIHIHNCITSCTTLEQWYTYNTYLCNNQHIRANHINSSDAIMLKRVARIKLNKLRGENHD